jgi:predicted phage terminase large subunit-like protein
MLMREIENNRALHAAFPDVLCGSDIRQYAKFSEDDGVIVKRKTNPNEATIEAWGLVDGQPTSKHFRVLLYDDVVVAGSVTTPEMIAKVMLEMERSYNLGTTPGVKRGAGTRWNFADAYRTVIDRGTLKMREHPGRKGGAEDGASVCWDEETHQRKRSDMGPYTYAAQILLNPKADSLQGFQREWLRTYRTITPAQAAKMNKYILVDAASSKKKGSDYTAIWVIGLGTDGNYYALDIVRDRLSLTERAERLFELHRKWKPRQMRYERYGLQADIEHLKTKMEADSYRFDITEVAGQTKKTDRIGRLIPIFEQGRMWLPKSLHITDYQKNTIDLVRTFVEEEYVAFPVGIHDDMLDALSRIAEPELRLIWPREQKVVDLPPPRRSSENRNAWMA